MLFLLFLVPLTSSPNYSFPLEICICFYCILGTSPPFQRRPFPKHTKPGRICADIRCSLLLDQGGEMGGVWWKAVKSTFTIPSVQKSARKQVFFCKCALVSVLPGTALFGLIFVPRFWPQCTTVNKKVSHCKRQKLDKNAVALSGSKCRCVYQGSDYTGAHAERSSIQSDRRKRKVIVVKSTFLWGIRNKQWW